MLRVLFAIVATVFALCVAVILFAPPVLRIVDGNLNRVVSDSASVSAEAEQLHRRLFIADLHCDALLWNRHLLLRSERGHVDVPRLQAGGVRLQVFSMPNAFPLFANYRRSPAFPDIMGLSAIANRWPHTAWRRPAARVLQQADTLNATAAHSKLALRVAPDSFWVSWLRDAPTGVVAILAVEGLHVRAGDTASLDLMFRAGVRVFGLAHMSDNALAGSAHGWRKYGLTPFGRRAVAHIDSLGGIIDLAHASEKTVEDVLALPDVRVMVSHTGVDGTCPGERNLSDAQLKAIAAHGGIIGIGFWKGAVCGSDAASIARAMRYAVNMAGINAIALGSDFDGAVRTPFDASGLVQLTDALLAEGFSEDEIARIMGLNALEFFERQLPKAPTGH